MHKESSVLCQCFVDANAVKVKLMSQMERVNSLQNWGGEGGGGGICTYTLYKYLCKSSRCSLVKLFDQIISTNMIDLNYFNMIINIFLIYTILQSFYHRHSHYWLEISKVALLILLNQHKFCQTFLKLKKKLKYLQIFNPIYLCKHIGTKVGQII